ncbi:MAG: hypothetical protein EHM34_09300 [Nitrosopumilales archaeon]|nr:MAG: hypothetical protein EHM34_09300 [Nitrosopumilales archaeon]
MKEANENEKGFLNMDNDLDIFRRRQERKKKKKKSIIPVDYPKHNTVLELDERVCFLGKDEDGEAVVYLSDGKTTECISKKAHMTITPTPEPRYDEVYYKGLEEFK